MEDLSKDSELIKKYFSSGASSYNQNSLFKKKISDLIVNDNFKDLIQEITNYENTLIKDQDFQNNLYYLNGIKLYVLLNSINDQLFSEFMKNSKREIKH